MTNVDTPKWCLLADSGHLSVRSGLGRLSRLATSRPLTTKRFALVEHQCVRCCCERRQRCLRVGLAVPNQQQPCSSANAISMLHKCWHFSKPCSPCRLTHTNLHSQCQSQTHTLLEEIYRSPNKKGWSDPGHGKDGMFVHTVVKNLACVMTFLTPGRRGAE